ncbi:MAG: hypothetical protein SGARI_000333 [Bacillariaceae sp.]
MDFGVFNPRTTMDQVQGACFFLNKNARPPPLSSSSKSAFHDLQLKHLAGKGFVSWGFEALLHNETVIAKVTTDKFIFYSDIEMDIFGILNAPPTIPNIPKLQLAIRSMPNPFLNSTYLKNDLGVNRNDTKKMIKERRVSVMAMKFLTGSRKATTLPEFRVFLQSLLETLAFVHSRNIIHCDLHSNNIHFDGKRVSLFDWNGAFVFEPDTVQIHQKYAPKHLFPPEAWYNESAVHATVSAFDIYTVGLLIKDALKKYWSGGEKDTDRTLANRGDVLDWLVDLAKQALKHDPYKRPDANKLLTHKFFSTPFIEAKDQVTKD